jgi:hypothetical protein
MLEFGTDIAIHPCGCHAEGDHLPIRLLDNFSVHIAEDERCLVPVDAVQFTYPRPVASGVVLPADGIADGDNGKQPSSRKNIILAVQGLPNSLHPKAV